MHKIRLELTEDAIAIEISPNFCSLVSREPGAFGFNFVDPSDTNRFVNAVEQAHQSLGRNGMKESKGRTWRYVEVITTEAYIDTMLSGIKDDILSGVSECVKNAQIDIQARLEQILIQLQDPEQQQSILISAPPG
ncbi:MAG: hypothetical protein EZS28_000248 [Streblomastix strix]|uniref:Uncharacterized protein n=1 Tax=Streblomastix strix TaxID=222440 RepID=A0A5J4XAD5_9EUKA|nr:MAG: hypothetical protein EZS28_000248 [Streblomastix strix]